MFDRLATNLLNGRPRTSNLYRDGATQTNESVRVSPNVRPVKVRNTVTGVVTYHPSVHDVLKHYPGTYPQLVAALIGNQGRVWNNIQIKDESDETPWPDPKQDVVKNKAGNKFVLFLLKNKETHDLRIETRIDAAKLLEASPATINSIALGISQDRPSYKWTVRYASPEDLVLVPTFHFNPAVMIFHKSVR